MSATSWLALLGIMLSVPALAVPSFDDVKRLHTKSDAWIVDRRGEILHERRVDNRGRRLDWVGLTEISASLQSAVLLAEDKRFYSHGGIDWRAVLSALVKRITSGGGRGASTISMQVAALLNPSLRAAGRRGLWEKWYQVREARALERQWSKAQILEVYLNTVSFRGELRGVAAASRGLFGKEPHGVDDVEAVVLASLIRSPNADLAKVAHRACALASKLEPNPDLKCGDVKTKVETVLSRPYLIRPRVALAPHVAGLLSRGASAGQEIVSTLDARLQRVAVESLKRHLLLLHGQNVTDGAVLVADNASGEVLAYVGNAGALSSQIYVDAIRAKRQAGSTLKPFLFGTAFERTLLTPASLLDDSPLDVSVSRGIYRPGNYDNRFHGLVTARVALASSLNIPAVRTLLLVGEDALVDKLRAFGFQSLDEAERYGPSLALGSADISLWDLVRAYRTFANDGMFSELALTPGEGGTGSRRALSAAASFLVSDILSDREARSLTFGLENPLATRFWTAVKTGTSKDMRDNWCVGYSSRYTVGVWVGNFSGEPMWNVSGVSGAAPVWIDVMNYLHRSEPSIAKRAPAGVSSNLVQVSAEKTMESFVSGTETSEVRPLQRRGRHRIVYPAADTVFALDPDIPAEAQRVFFEAERGLGRVRWRLNGELLPAAEGTTTWEPRKGRFTLALLDEKDEVVDSVAFEVRPTVE